MEDRIEDWIEDKQGIREEEQQGIHTRIKSLRTHFALSQEQFAKRIHRTTGFISNIETGRSGISDSTIALICSEFSIREAWLRYGTGEMFNAGDKRAAVDKRLIGSRIKEIRKREGLTQAEFGERIGFHKNQIYYVEVGKSIPSATFLSDVSREFGVSVDWLRTGMEDERDPVDEGLIEWLRMNPAREIRIRAGL